MRLARFCLFCGDDVPTGRGRMHGLEDMQSFLHQYIKPTNFHCQALLQLNFQKSASDHCKLCIFCSNWKRHVISTSQPTNKKTEFTPLDHLIMYTLEPGAVQEPDHRCLKRLITAATSLSNPFRHLIPFPCLTIMQACQDFAGEELPAQIALQWWKFNQHTSFFRSKKTAKIVRRALRQKKLYSNLEKKPKIRWRH